MRRPKFEPWETEARDATERLRQVLAVLKEQETAFRAGTVDGEELFEALGTVTHTQETVSRWCQDWLIQTSGLKTSRSVALSVFRGCLPGLAGVLDVYIQSLTICALSPDLDGGDGDLAGKGVRAAKDVASYQLQFLDDTPSLRPVDRAAVDATLAVLDSQSEVLVALTERIGGRARALRMAAGFEA